MITDPLHTRTAPDSFWTITNLGEAFPGVLTPLGWSIIGVGCEVGFRAGFHALGAIGRADTKIPDREEDWAYGCFFGRAALRVDWMARTADRIPGANGAAVAEQFVGVVPPNVARLAPYRRRYPLVAARFPITLARVPSLVRSNRVVTERLWAHEIARTPTLDIAGARHQVAVGAQAVIAAISVDTTKLLGGVQPVYDALLKLASSAGVDTARLEAGHGSHEETELVQDLWAYSRDRISFDEVLARHGFHGPREGEVSSRVWRENPDPLRKIAESYRQLPDHADPTLAQQERWTVREQAQRELLAALPRHQRPAGALVLKLAHRYLPLRGKAARLQGLDIARAGARRLGELQAQEGTINQPDDVFFLTVDEIKALPPDLKTLIAHRRQTWTDHHKIDLPVCWEGEPTPLTTGRQNSTSPTIGAHVQGLGASTGIVEGRVCVVTDPSFAEDDIHPGDVLVAHTTDPSWASVMFASSALVVDIGGMLSHAAVLARELGIPCVMGTGTGTGTLRTGDQVRVNGATGRVEILVRS